MTSQRPRVVIDVSARLFRDALCRTLSRHFEVVIAPDSEVELAAWVATQQPFDAAIISRDGRVVDLEAGLVVELPAAEDYSSRSPAGTVRSGRAKGQSITSLHDLLDVLPTGC